MAIANIEMTNKNMDEALKKVQEIAEGIYRFGVGRFDFRKPPARKSYSRALNEDAEFSYLCAASVYIKLNEDKFKKGKTWKLLISKFGFNSPEKMEFFDKRMRG